MDLANGMTLKQFILAGTVLCILSVKGIESQQHPPVTALETEDVQLVILIPDNEQASSATYITVRLDRGSGASMTDVAYLLKDGPRVTEGYASRLEVVHVDKTVTLLLRDVSAADAGTYKCFSSSGTAAISDCGQLLVIIRKPNPPIVKVLPTSSLLVGSDTELVCETYSASLPQGHGLASEVFWYDQNGRQILYSGNEQRIHVNPQNYLEIKRLGRADRGLSFSCASADNAGSVRKRVVSDKSDAFEVIPEYSPTYEDFRLTPAFSTDEAVRKVLGERITYRCEAECNPPCQTFWLYRPHGSTAGFGRVTNLVDTRVLALDVTRINEGSYQCRAQNEHGSVRTGFHLEALYMGNPKVSINDLETTHSRIIEGTQVNLLCVFDSNPGPVVTWSSPFKTTLFVQNATGPEEKLISNGIYTRVHFSRFSLTNLRCEDSGVYKCEGRNSVSSGEGRMDLMVMCPPQNAGIPGLDLLSEYVWEIPQPLKISFVVRALPEPGITRIISSVRGQHRKEEMPGDFAITKESNHDGKMYLTKLTLTSRRSLSMSDADRIFILTMESSEFKQDFSFVIRPRGAPYEVMNLTARNVGHDSLTLSWKPSFSGGEPQRFSVELCAYSPAAAEKDGPQQCLEEQSWITVLENIPEEGAGTVVDVQITSLRSNTDYVIRVTASNLLGATMTETQVKTMTAPDEGLGKGAVAGIVIAVLIFLVVIACITGFFVYRKYQERRKTDTDGDETTEAKQSMLPKRVTALLKKKSKRTEAGGEGQPETSPRESLWARLRNFVRKKRAKNTADHVPEPPSGHPVSDVGIEDSAGTGDYITSPAVKTPTQNDDIAYADIPGINNNADGSKTQESGRESTEHSLNYAEVEFPQDQKKAENTPANKKSDNRVHYADINFTETAAKRKEIEGGEQI